MTILQDHYRPRTFDQVVGQEAAVRALSGVLKREASRVFLLTGPSGVGKTTLARIASREAGCRDGNIKDVNAAKNTGVDAMRAIEDLARIRPFGKSPWRSLVIDECHRLSAQAWDSLLKALEEPPQHVIWFLCTTEPRKVPKTIQTRSTPISLKAVGDVDLRKLYARVAEAERIKLPQEVRDAVIRESEGSPRQMLVYLALCRDVTSRKEASELLRDARESDYVVELCKFLLQRGSWAKAAVLLEKLSDESTESVRIGVCNYLGGALRRARSDKEACAVLALMEPFVEPFAAGADRAMLAVAVGRALYSGD